jgi:SAM-dependent methyltransferase
MSTDAPVNDPIYCEGTTYGDNARDRIRFCGAEIARRKPQTIIDVGCYLDFLSRIIKERFPSVDLIGTGLLLYEPFRRSMEGILEELAEIEFDPFYYQNTEVPRRMPRPDQSADLIIATEILEHVTDPLPLLRDFRRVLRPQGCVLLTTPNVSSLGAILRLMRGRSNYEAVDCSVICVRNDWRAHIRLYAKDEIADLSGRSGLAMTYHKYYATLALEREWVRRLGWLIRRIGGLLPRWREDQMAVLSPVSGGAL